MDRENESTNIEREHSLFYKTLRSTLHAYEIDFNDFVGSCQLSNMHKDCLKNDNKLTIPPTKVYREVIRSLVGSVQPRDLTRVLVSGVSSEEHLRELEPYFQSLENVEDMRGVWYVLKKERLSSEIVRLSEEMASLDKSR